MKNLLTFFKLTAQGGLLVLLPVLLFILLIKEMVSLVVGLATPIAGFFLGGAENPQYPLALAVVVLVSTSFVIGIAMKSSAAKKLGGWAEEKTIKNLSIYQFVKTLVSGLLGAGENVNFKPALFDTQTGIKEIIYLIEDLGNGEFVALFPVAPTGFAGPVRIIHKDRIIPLEASLGEVNLVLNHMGMGASQLLKTNRHRNNDK
jgi:uncharacterized membrane protein